jgi:hypothetical protein
MFRLLPAQPVWLVQRRSFNIDAQGAMFAAALELKIDEVQVV